MAQECLHKKVQVRHWKNTYEIRNCYDYVCLDCNKKWSSYAKPSSYYSVIEVLESLNARGFA